jgi:hypothetical protein
MCFAAMWAINLDRVSRSEASIQNKCAGWVECAGTVGSSNPVSTAHGVSSFSYDCQMLIRCRWMSGNSSNWAVRNAARRSDGR